jgi:uncharacterized membrane protein
VPNLGDSIASLGLLITIGTLGVILVMTVLIVGVVAWAIRRATPRAEDPAVAELRRRLADGEITPVEYEVRLRALQQGD